MSFKGYSDIYALVQKITLHHSSSPLNRVSSQRNARNEFTNLVRTNELTHLQNDDLTQAPANTNRAVLFSSKLKF